MLAVLLAALAAMVVGSLWYGPLFGKPWMKLMNFTKKDMEKMPKSKMAQSYGLMFLGLLVMGSILGAIQMQTAVEGLGEALMQAGVLWLGFLTFKSMSGVLWGRDKWALWLLNTSHDLISILVMAAVLFAIG